MRRDGKSSFSNDGGNSDPGELGGRAGCDQDPALYNRCMTRMDDLEGALLSSIEPRTSQIGQDRKCSSDEESNLLKPR